jgi:creatinine amidohydrolase
MTLDEIDEAARSRAVAILPVGATEQHGPHLVAGTDTYFAETFCLHAAARTGDIVLPPLAYGCSLGHTDRWPGTLSLTPQTLAAMVVELGRWIHASGFRRMIMVNAHATNGPPCQSALLQLRYEYPDLRLRFVSVFELSPEITERYTHDGPDGHANEAETSLMLHMNSAGVHHDRAVDEPDPTVGRVFQYPMPAVSQHGVVGAPTTSTSDSGASLHAAVVDALVELFTTARAESDPVFPP